MDEIMKQFQTFLSEGEKNNDFNGALNSVVKDIISKESMYPPMKKLQEEFPKWLETNWENCKDDELERYNKQLDKVNEICNAFEKEDSD